MKISCEEDIKRMYELRNDSDAVLVGIGTVLSDDPKLTVKEKSVKNPKQPIRIVLDTYCRTPIDALVVNDAAKTLVIIGKDCNKKFLSNVELIKCKIDEKGLIDLENFIQILKDKGIKKLMVEGGSTVIGSFLKLNLVDDMFVYVAPIIIGGINTPTLVKNIDESINLKLVETKKIGLGILLHYRLIK
ncbi:MAG: dihydrofolate reductase family protein, partial [Candidatus Thermoplasmatota archaeon]|nr:dihydrofolate reductase family protein [Candidatus Thermoplasmatota archaeon]